MELYILLAAGKHTKRYGLELFRYQVRLHSSLEGESLLAGYDQFHRAHDLSLYSSAERRV